MNIPELLDPLATGEDIEVVITRMPEWALALAERDGDLHRLDGGAEESAPWFGDQKMDVLGHDDVAEDAEAVAQARAFERVLEEGACRVRPEEWSPLETAEGDEVIVA